MRQVFDKYHKERLSSHHNYILCPPLVPPPLPTYLLPSRPSRLAFDPRRGHSSAPTPNPLSTLHPATHEGKTDCGRQRARGRSS